MRKEKRRQFCRGYAPYHMEAGLPPDKIPSNSKTVVEEVVGGDICEFDSPFVDVVHDVVVLNVEMHGPSTNSLSELSSPGCVR